MGDGDDRWRTSSRLSFSDLYGTSEVDLAIRRSSAGMDAWLSDLAVINPLAGDGASPQVVMHTLKLRNAAALSAKRPSRESAGAPCGADELVLRGGRPHDPRVRAAQAGEREDERLAWSVCVRAQQVVLVEGLREVVPRHWGQ